ncbi:hypothetical protein MMC07_000369 [Pseudocyphellaria aurata]|nr:hypothetical protein [Pseudocyphellaria aurata]
MNISQPVASYIGSVDFGFLTAKEIETLSVKKIHSSTTFDKLLNPIPGGLHDAALGPWGDNACSTCHLKSYACPGHVGHIELPAPVYHITFMEQLLRLLRAKCAYCGHLKMHRPEINRFTCKLQLIQHGLLKEAAELENIHLKTKTSKAARTNGAASDIDMESEDSEEEDEDLLQQRRSEFVNRAIKNAGGSRHKAEVATEKVEAMSEERRAVIKEFLTVAPAVRTCGHCKGVSHLYRKDKYTKIFQRPLSVRDKAKMRQGGFKAVNPLIKALSERKAMQKQKRDDRAVDEGIVADLEDITSDDDGEDIEMLGIETETAKINGLEGQDKGRLKKSSAKELGGDVYLNPQEVHAALSELFATEKEILNIIYNSRAEKDSPSVSADIFFIKNILVTPNKFRPQPVEVSDEINEAHENLLYKEILRQCDNMNQISAEIGGLVPESTTQLRDFRDLQNKWILLQGAVNTLIDVTQSPTQGVAGRLNQGIKQKLERKEGLFRKNMMGKRVNFAARSVISPDPNIEPNEIGVPPVFAKKLTYPEPVTNHNFYELKEAVLNGVDRWPGATAIENENGQVISLRTKTLEERQAIANQLLAPSNTSVNGARSKKVHRHLNNGDIVLMNRQPTLHKPSMMSHRARILPGEKTIRMHYANCNTYNADFDGDEMNLHFPQNEVARAEALQIADTDHQYLVATSGKPLRGLIQDHISMGVWLSNRDSLFDREDYQQLLYGCLRPENNHTTSDRIQTVMPAILKPRSMWTGKQVITTILKNITPETHPGLTLLGKSQTSGDRWGVDSEEDIVIFQDGELLCGVLDKAHLGPSGGGFIHSIHEAYGHIIAGKLLGILGRLLTNLLQMRAFSCGMDDLLLTEAGNAKRRQKLQEAEKIGLEVAAKYVTLDSQSVSVAKELRARLEDVLRDDEKQVGLDRVFNSRTATLSSEVTTACLPDGLDKPFPKNQMQAMTGSGAKGTAVNANLISCNLGQQVLEGRRVPVMVSGKTLPSFKPFETNVRAGGYITDRFLTGVRPQEYFFHAMAGREGLIDTAIKTASSGYLQRCLIKGMEGLRVEYDSSVRDSDGAMVQFLYGEDGLDVTKQKHLKDFKFLAENYMSLVAQLNMKEEFSKIPNSGAKAHQKAAMRKVRKAGRVDAMDPVLAHFNPGSNKGSTSESFAAALRAYCKANPEGLLKEDERSPDAALTVKTFSALLNIKYMKSVVDPGEAVGIVAGQSIGEPSTQMTLNTFHLAGHSVRNVTLGIPRLREIVMSASKHIRTPTMTLHIIPELSHEAGEKFAKGITKVTLAEVVDNIEVREKIGKGITSERAKIYDIRLDFFPSAEYQETYAIKVSDVLKAMELEFIPHLTQAIKKELHQKDHAESRMSAAQPDVGKSSGRVKDAPSSSEANRESGNDEEDNGDEDDATNDRQTQNRDDGVSYAAPDEEEEAIAKQAQRQSTPDTDVDDEGFSESPRQFQQEGDAKEHDENPKVVSRMIGRDTEDRIKENNPQVARFSFDEQGGEWCEIRLEYDVFASKLLILSLVEGVCRKAVIQSIANLGDCTYTHERSRDPVTGIETTHPVVLTTGVNLRAMHAYQSILNPHKIFTNDINAMLTLYGVEACRATIIREMDAVFKGHSIAVDNRHLNLIGDVMTKGGGFSAFNRGGLKGSVSPFMKMSFETTVGFLRDAVLDGDWDDLKGPSARIVVGRPGRMGTGAFDVLMPIA